MTKTPETKLTVDGEFNPNREGPSEMKFTWSDDSARQVLTIQADGKIVVHDDASPEEVSKAIESLLQTRENETVEKIAAWLGDGPNANCDDRSIAYDIRDRAWKQ